MSSFTAELALIAWIPIVLALFALLKPRTALLVTFVAGWLFLPMAKIDLPALPDFAKPEAICLGALSGVLMLDSRRLARLRPHWIDLPLLLWCLAPIPTSLSNELGLHDGLSGAFVHVVRWGIPFFLGRAYLETAEGLLEFARYMIIGAIAYLPLCWLEIRLSPHLHQWIYGSMQHSFAQTIRYGGYRPMVFMPHPIALSVFLASSAAMLYWLWSCRMVRKIGGVPAWLPLVALAATLIACKTMTGLVVFALACCCYWLQRIVSVRLVLAVLITIPPLYMGLRLSGALPAESLVNLVEKIDGGRAGSLAIRLRQEDLFSKHTWERPLFGWGGWDRNFPTSPTGQRLVKEVDGFWTIALSKHGVFGLAVATFLMLAGPLAVAWHVSASQLASPRLAPVAVITLVVCTSAIDNLFNGFANPLVYLGAGGLAQFSAKDPVRIVAASLLPRRLVTGEAL